MWALVQTFSLEAAVASVVNLLSMNDARAHVFMV